MKSAHWLVRGWAHRKQNEDLQVNPIRRHSPHQRQRYCTYPLFSGSPQSSIFCTTLS